MGLLEDGTHLLLQLLVGVVDTELLETVLLEVLKSVDILRGGTQSV
jgi:hypothetical protein